MVNFFSLKFFTSNEICKPDQTSLFFFNFSLFSHPISPLPEQRKSIKRMSGPVMSYSCKQNRPGPYPQEAYYSIVGEGDYMWIINIKCLIK